MTSITTIFGVFPLAIGLGRSGDYATTGDCRCWWINLRDLINLIVVPTIFGLSNNKKLKKELLENESDER